MNLIIYLFCVPFVYLFSIFPLFILYRISDLLYYVAYYVIRYRKKVLLTNLRNSFPEKSEAEIKEISKKFYRHFCDILAETVKTLTVSDATLFKRIHMDNPEIFQHFKKKNQSIIIAMGHIGNWDLAIGRMSLEYTHSMFAVYHPLSNPYFDKLVHKMRSRLVVGLIPMKNTYKRMVENKHILNATILIADQAPSPKNAIWTTFLNQDTPVFPGTEKLAQKLNYPVVYLSVYKPKRGYYRIVPEIVAENPNEFTEEEITKLHTQKLEANIRQQPEIWLWTHRRWKHKRKK